MKHTKRNFWTLILLAVSALCLIFAACGGKGVKLTFETNGGPAVEAQTVDVGTEVELPVPTRDGYTFEGWFATADLSGDPVTEVVAESDMTFYAKWSQVFSLTLDVGEGQLSSTKFTLKAGAPILESVKDHIPTRAGWEFGEWLLDGAAVSSAMTMPEHDITLTARYKVGYTVKVWLQKSDRSGYEAGEDITGYDYPAANYTPKAEVKGFGVADHEGQVRTKDLSETPANNVYTVYFDRNTYTVTLISNYPEGAEERRTVSFLFGSEVELPYDAFHMDGYLLLGWAVSASGENEYPSQAIKGMLQNGDGKEYKDVFAFEDNITLYAVWQKGYHDLFGGSDVMYLFAADKSVILSRGGYYYQGEYNERNGTFAFSNAAGNLQGGIYGEGFYYNDLGRVSDYVLYLVGTGLDSTQTIRLRENNEIVYSRQGGSSNGTYYLGSDGFHHAEFTTGPLAGTAMTLFLGEAVTADGTRTPAFMIRRDNEAELGRMDRFGISPQGTVGTLAYFQLTLDGFERADMAIGTSVTAYLYASDGEYFTLYNTSDFSEYGTFKFMVHSGRTGYIPYYGDMDHTYTGENGQTLELDGTCNAIYTAGNSTRIGYYSAVSSLLGGYIITFYPSAGEPSVFRVTNGGTAEEPVYALEEKEQGYEEYYYSAEALYSPLLVIDDAAAGKGSVYSRTIAGRVYVKVAEGSIVPIEGTDRFTFTVTENLTPEEAVYINPIDVLRLKAFTYSLGVSPDYYSVAYWYSVTYAGEEATELEVVYTGEGGTLTLVGGFIIYKAEGKDALTGTYTTLSGYEKTTIRATLNSRYYYFELDSEGGGFVVLDKLLGGARGRTAAGTVNSNESFSFDGKGGATLTTAVEEGDDIVTKGTYEEKDEDLFGTQIYHFTPEEGEGFDFILTSSSSTSYFTRLNTEMPTKLTSASGATLTLDGYSHNARYTDASGTVNGTYTVSDGAIAFTANGILRYFDVTDSSFTERSAEAGTYLHFENQYESGLAFELDGYGTARILMFSATDATAEPEELGVGTYRRGEKEGTWVIEFADASNKTHTYTGRLGLIPISETRAINVFIVEHEEIVRSYVDESDWSILTPDSAGNAVFRTASGTTENGACVIISEDLLYYVNTAGTYGCVYRYDAEKGTIQKMTSQQYYYYSADLRSLRFSRYGFVTRDGDTQYFYVTDAEGKITAYRQAPGTEGENEYGFVTEDFGTLGADSITVDGVIYYNNDGYSINFERSADSAADYPYPYRDAEGNESKKSIKALSFQPTGAVSFRVAGTVYLDGIDTPRTCVVVREAKLNEDGETVFDESGNPVIEAFYVLIGSFRCDITVDYHGKTGNFYTVDTMKYVLSVNNNAYYQAYLYLYMYYGANYANSLSNVYGNFTLTREYNREGDITEEYLDADLGISDVTLLDGTVIEKLEHKVMGEELEIVSGRYVVTYQGEGEDKNTYKFYFVLGVNNLFGVYVYNLAACVRVQSLDWEGYHIETERIVASDTSAVGAVFDLNLTKNGEEIDLESVYVDENDVLYCVSRTRTHLPDDEEGVNSGEITDSTYYIITTVEEKVEEEGGGSAGDETTVVPLYTSFTLTEKQVRTVYNNSGNSYVDIDKSDNKVVGFYYNGGMYLPTSSEYNEETRTYTVTVSNGAKLAIRIETGDSGDVAIFSVVTDDTTTA